MATAQLTFREGTARDLADTFALAERALHEVAVRQGVMAGGRGADRGGDPVALAAGSGASSSSWPPSRTAATGSRRTGDEIVGFARVVRFGRMEELTELMVDPEYQRQGIGRALLERCWPGDPTPDLGRVVVATGAPADLTLYPDFGVMPVTGHWHMRVSTERYLERRAHEVDAREPDTRRALTASARSRSGGGSSRRRSRHERPALHEFFARDRTCLATLSQDGDATGLCWVRPHGEIGPAVGAEPEDLVPVVLAALDRVAKTQEPEELSLFCTTIAWWLLRRLRGLGF